MFKKVVYIHIALLFKLYCFSQNNTADSLKLIINSSAHDTSRITALYNVLSYLPPNECEHYNDKLITLSEKLLNGQKITIQIIFRFKAFLAEGYYNKGVFLSNRNINDSALLFYEKGLHEFKTLKDDQMIAYTIMSMAIIYTTKGHYDKAVNMLYQSLKIHEKNSDWEGIGDTYMHIGRIYHIQKEYNEALKYTHQALIAYKKVNYKTGMFEALYKLGFIELDLLNYSKSKEYFNSCVKLSDELGLKEKSKVNQMLDACLGYMSYHSNKIDSAIYYFKKSVEFANSSNETHTIGVRYLDLARAYLKNKQNNEALTYGNKALQMGYKTKNLDLQYDVSYFLSLAYKVTQNYKNAFEMQEMHLKMHDSIQRVEQKKSVLKQQLKHEYEKKELIAKSKYENEINTFVHNAEKSDLKKNIGIAFLIFVILITIIIAFLIYKHQKQKTIIETQNSNILKQKMLLTQMNPHFIFNSINSIQNFILQKNEKDAYAYLAKFSKLIRMVLNNSESNKLMLYEEIELIKTYIEIEQLRFDNVFEFILKIDDTINEQEISIPPMLVQPYIENAIWHGLMNLDNARKGKLEVEFLIKNDLLKIIVQDNGIGRELAHSYKKDSHKPIAMNITKKRLDIIHSLHKKEYINIQVHDLYDSNNNPSGTRVEIYLPFEDQYKNE